MKSRLFLFAFLILAVSVVASITSAQRRTDADKPLTGDFKITLRQTVAGQTSESTTMIKGQRERSETSNAAFSMVSITQCDMRRTIQINDRARKYLISPMDDDSATTNTTAGTRTNTPSTRGGVVTMTVNTVDTGERKDFMGYTARHLKRTTIMESSPDACSQQKMKIETDGWYINLEYGLTCPANRSGYTGEPSSGGCRDRYVYKNTGPSHIGFPVQETTTMYGPDGSVTMTMTKEVVEISRQPLDAALFDVPAGYTQATSQQEMYSMPSMAEMMSSSQQQNQAQSGNQSQSSAPAARIRVGVVQVNNKTKTSASTDSLQQQLVAALSAEGIDAVALNAISPSEAVTEAQAKQVNYILYTDIATLKSPSAGKKIGGMFGRATGIGSGDSGKAEAKLDFRLVPTGSSSPVAQSSATAKEETAEASLSAAIRGEVQAVVGSIPRP